MIMVSFRKQWLLWLYKT